MNRLIGVRRPVAVKGTPQPCDYTQLYMPDPVAKGQFWHYVAYLYDPEGHEYGAQLSIFRVNGVAFAHCAVTDVAKRSFTFQEVMIDRRKAMVANENADGHTLCFDCRGIAVTLHSKSGIPRGYGVDTSIHYGYPRLSCEGFIGWQAVKGVLCFDRETFNKLMLPNEVGWDWMVLWLEDGRTLLRYVMVDEDLNVTRVRSGCDDVEPTKLFIDPIVPGQSWPKNDRRTFGYTEALCRVIYDGVNGRGYLERVGLDGKVEL